jgi:two-component system, NarL family, sensor histidine kinase DesK
MALVKGMTRQQQWLEGEIERTKGPNGFTFLPWLLMGIGALSHLLQGKADNPWLAGAGLLAFNSLYIGVVFSAFRPAHRPAWGPYVQLGLLGAVTYTLGIGYGGSWLLFFPLFAIAAGTLLRGRDIGVFTLVVAGSAGWISSVRGDGPWGGVTIGYGTLLSGMVTATLLSLVQAVRQLRETRQELARTAVEKERLRFSRDLHDLLGHTLSVVVVKAEAVRRVLPHDVEAAMGQAADIEAVGRQALTEIREAVTGYREGSLRAELAGACSLLEASGIEPVTRQEGAPLPPQAETLLSWVVREAATNAVRHSGASRCEIAVRNAEGRVRLTVTDDGRGPVGSPEGDGKAAAGHTGGTGLRGLAERLAAAGGRLDHGPDGGRGFRLVAELPVEAEETAQ